MEPPHLLHFLPPENPDGKNQTRAKKQRYKHIMGKLKDSVFTNIVSSNHPSGTLTQEAKAYIENKLRGMFQTFDTPTHPPYALMIRTAIIELDEEAGSSEESISGYIEREYEGLPCGHVAFLGHHLRRLCKSGEIVCKNDGRYMIGVEGVEEMGQRMNISQNMRLANHVREELQNEQNEEAAKETRLIEQKIEEDCQAQRQELEVIDDCSKVKEMQIVVFEEQSWHAVGKQVLEERIETSRQGIEATEQQMEVPYLTHGSSVELNDKEQNCPQSQLHEVIKESNHSQQVQVVVREDNKLVSGQQNRAIEEQNILQERRTEFMNERRMEGQLVNIPSASETLGQCLDCNVSSYSLKESCIELVTKKTDSLDHLTEKFCSFGGMEQPQQLTKSPCTDIASNVEVIKGQKQLQEQGDRLIRGESQSLELQNQVETELVSLDGMNRDVFNENSLVGESRLLTVKEYLKESLKQVHLQQQAKIIRGDWKHIVCGVRAQRLTEACDKLKTPRSHLIKEQKQLSWSRTRRCCRPKLNADTTTNALVLSDHHHDIEQKQDHQLEDQQKIPESCLENQQSHRSRSRARKLCRPKLDADTTTSFLLALSSDRQQDREQKLRHEPMGQLKPSKAGGNGDYPSHTSLRLTTETCDKLKTCKLHSFKNQQRLSCSRTRWHRRPKLDADITTNALSPSDHESDIVHLDADTTANALLVPNHHHDIEQKQDHQLEGQVRLSRAEVIGDQQKAPKSSVKNKQPHGSRSRTRKSHGPKLDADTTTSSTLALPSDRQQDCEQKLHHEPVGQLKPSKAKGNGDQQKVMEAHLDNEQSCQTRSRARKSRRHKLDADTTMSFILALPSDRQQDHEQKLHHNPVGQLKHSKAEGNGDQQKASESRMENKQPHLSRSGARKPRRPKLDANTTMSSILALPSDRQQDREQKLQHQPEGQARPSNAALADPHFHGLVNGKEEISRQPISKLEFEFERRKLTEEDVRELIYREILEYHPHMLQEYLEGTDHVAFMYPSDIEQFACLEEQYGNREAASQSKENIAPWPRINSNDESANLTDLTKKRTASVTWATLRSPPRLQEFADLKSGSRNTSQNGSSHRKCSAHLRTNSISASKCMDMSK